MIKYIIVIIFLFSSFELTAKESLLTLKQQLDRLQREVSDLNQSLYKESSNQSSTEMAVTNSLSSPSNLTAFDLRIYDLEKDIKILNENFEELIFQVDDLKKLFDELNLNVSTKLLNQNNKIVLQESDDIILPSAESKVVSIIDEDNKNILGSLIINSKDLTTNNESLLDVNQDKNLLT